MRKKKRKKVQDDRREQNDEAMWVEKVVTQDTSNAISNGTVPIEVDSAMDVEAEAPSLPDSSRGRKRAVDFL